MTAAKPSPIGARGNCTKCRLSALCLPAGGPERMAWKLWQCKDCSGFFLETADHSLSESRRERIKVADCAALVNHLLSQKSMEWRRCYDCRANDVS